MTCVFCAVVAGDAPADVVLDTPTSVGFLDVRPVFEGHVLVVPRLHVETLPELPTELLAPYFADVQRVTGAMVSGFGAEGAFVAQNNVISQSVPHLHTHVVPRHRKDGLRGFFWPRVRYADHAARAAVAERLRQAIAEAGDAP